LLGLSGVSGDMRVLQKSKDPLAIAAVECFIYAMTKYAGAYAAVPGGLDALSSPPASASTQPPSARRYATRWRGSA